MCPQKVYDKAFILQTNWCSLPQEFSTPTRLKIQTNVMTHLHYLTIISAINKCLLNIVNLGKLDHCCSCYSKFEQHWIKCWCVHISLIIQHLGHKKVSALHCNGISQKSPNCGLVYFSQHQNKNFNIKQFKILN